VCTKSTNVELARIMTMFNIDEVAVAEYLDVPVGVVNNWISTEHSKSQKKIPQSELRRLIQILMMENIRLLNKT